MQFRAKLEPSRKPASVRYFYFAGTQQRMSPVVYVDSRSVAKAELDDAGDGTVPSWSAMLQRFQGQPVGGAHGSLYKDGDLRKTLAVLLGKPGLLLPVGTQVELAIRDRVAQPGQPVVTAIKFRHAVQDLKGELVLDRVVVDAAGNETSSAPIDSKPLNYSGVATQGINVQISAPAIPAPYRLRLVENGRTLASDEFFVQT